MLHGYAPAEVSPANDHSAHAGKKKKQCASVALFGLHSITGTVAQIAQQPRSQSVLAGATAVFNCSLPCSGNPIPVTWYLTMPDTGRSIAISQYTSFSQVKAIYGIELSRSSVDECSVGGYRVEQLAVNRPSRQLNLMPVQCAALCFDSCPCSSVHVYFSKYALLLVSGKLLRVLRRMVTV